MQLLTASARTTSGQGPAVYMGDQGLSVSVRLAVSGISGVAATLGVEIQWSDDKTTWYSAIPADDFGALLAVGNVVKNMSIKGPFARVIWTVAGTLPSVTFGVGADTRAA